VNTDLSLTAAMAKLAQIGFDGEDLPLGSAIGIALERGATLDDVSAQLGVAQTEIEARFPLEVKNA
jgi:hypothetical protein